MAGATLDLSQYEVESDHSASPKSIDLSHLDVEGAAPDLGNHDRFGPEYRSEIGTQNAYLTNAPIPGGVGIDQQTGQPVLGVRPASEVPDYWPNQMRAAQKAGSAPVGPAESAGLFMGHARDQAADAIATASENTVDAITGLVNPVERTDMGAQAVPPQGLGDKITRGLTAGAVTSPLFFGPGIAGAAGEAAPMLERMAATGLDVAGKSALLSPESQDPAELGKGAAIGAVLPPAMWAGGEVGASALRLGANPAVAKGIETGIGAAGAGTAAAATTKIEGGSPQDAAASFVTGAAMALGPASRVSHEIAARRAAEAHPEVVAKETAAADVTGAVASTAGLDIPLNAQIEMMKAVPKAQEEAATAKEDATQEILDEKAQNEKDLTAAAKHIEQSHKPTGESQDITPLKPWEQAILDSEKRMKDSHVLEQFAGEHFSQSPEQAAAANENGFSYPAANASETNATAPNVSRETASAPFTYGAEADYIHPSDTPDQAHKVRYALASLDSIQASHLPDRGFAENPAYPKGLQDRDYTGDVGEQNKVARNASNLDPRLIANRSLRADDAPPIVDTAGTVLSGNSRTMSLRMARDVTPERFAAYKDHLRRNAAEFGLTPEQVDAIKDPVLVRVADVKPEEAGAFAAKANASSGARMTSAQMAATLVTKLPREATDQLLMASDADRLGDALSEPRVQQALGKAVESLLGPNEAKAFFSNGQLTADGKNLAKQALYFKAIGDRDLARYVAADEKGLRQRIENALWQINRVHAEAGKEWAIKAPLQKALKLIAENPEADTAAEILGQQDFASGRKTVTAGPKATALLEALLGPPTRLREVLKPYVEAATGQGGMFDAKDPGRMLLDLARGEATKPTGKRAAAQEAATTQLFETDAGGNVRAKDVPETSKMTAPLVELSKYESFADAADGSPAPMRRRDRTSEMRSRRIAEEPTIPSTTSMEGKPGWGRRLYRELAHIPKFTEFRKTVGEYDAQLQRGSIEARNLQRKVLEIAPKGIRREGIANWIDAGGDTVKLLEAAKNAPTERLRRGYEAALDLTTPELIMARDIKQMYADLAEKAQARDLIGEARNNYVNRVWLNRTEKEGATPIVGSGPKLKTQFKFGKKRTFDSFAEGEALGFKPRTKDVADLLGIYMHEMSRAIAGRDFVKGLSDRSAQDGRPLAVPAGMAERVGDGEGVDPKEQAFLIKPQTKGADYSDYQGISGQPALTKWKWVGEDYDGRPALMRSDLVLHPSILDHTTNMLGGSALRKAARSEGSAAAVPFKLLYRGASGLNSGIKQFMLAGVPSGFHAVTEATHALGHRVNPLFHLPKIDPANPEVSEAMAHGLTVSGQHIEMQNFKEGLAAGPWTRRLGPYGKVVNGWNEFLFQSFIPRLKLKTYYAIRDRNMELFSRELKAGEATQSDVLALSAEQANAAYGELNYNMIGRNATKQDFFRLFALAPDFLEARGRFVGQAAKGLVGKAGREQLHAMAFIGGAIFVASRILNKALDDDYHWNKPFSVVYKGREYALRSVPGDVWNMLADTRQFVSGRLSPLSRWAFQLYTGKNWRGEKMSALEDTAELGTMAIPLPLREAPGVKNLTPTKQNSPVTPWESFMGSMGMHIKRYSPVAETYHLANEYNKSRGIALDETVYPISKYQALRYALEDGNMDAAKAEFQKLADSGMTRNKIKDGARASFTKPFTGTQQSDVQFAKSLSGRDLETYKKAQRQRLNVVNALSDL